MKLEPINQRGPRSSDALSLGVALAKFVCDEAFLSRLRNVRSNKSVGAVRLSAYVCRELQKEARRRPRMGEDKLKGKANEIAGGVRREVGDATDNEGMEAEGTEQQYKGKAQGAIGDIKDKAEDLKDKVT